MIGLIRALDIERWASRITATSEFPRLVRLLVHATANGLKQVDFPADEAVRLSGWDGKVLTDGLSSFVPMGISVWELGTGQDPRSKANEDYSKRTADPLGIDPRQATFIFATPRRWPGRNTWIEEKRAEGIWKNVIAFDAENFTQWLEIAPSVGAWFAPLVGSIPTDVRALETFCDEYRKATNPALNLSGLLVARDSEREKLVSFLLGPPHFVEVSATTTSEATAFIGACIESLPEHERDSLWARAIWSDSSAGLRAIASSERPLIIVTSNELPSAGAQNHLIKVGTSPGKGTVNEIRLGMQQISALVEYLANQGLDRSEAYRRCKEAGGFLERVRHTLFAVSPQPPDWATPTIAVTLAAAILIGEWDESYDTDKAIVSSIAGVDYHQFIQAIAPFQSGPSPLVSHTGTVWKVFNRSAAWKYLEPLLTSNHLNVFLQSTHDVLMEADPRYELAPDERWMANIHGKQRQHSSHLREGLVNGLLHCAVLGMDHSACYGGQRAQGWIDGTCRRLFDRHGENNFWRRIYGELQELAEASPDQFLTALETDLEATQPQVLDLFEEEGMHGACLHANLLWALELLAWAPEHVGRVALALAALANIDPGGHWGNRPLGSLTELLLPAKPQCCTTADERKQIYTLISERFPDVGWNLGKAMIPSHSIIVTPNAQPRLRKWASESESKPVLRTDCWAEIQDIAEKLVELAGKAPERWHYLLSELNSFLPPLKERVMGMAGQLSHEIEGEGRLSFWALLRDLLHKHNQFSQEEKVRWVYSREILDRLESLYNSLTPVDPINQVSWLFSFHVERPIGVAADWQEEDKNVKAAQVEAAEMLITFDIKMLVDALPRFENKRLLGYYLGRSSQAKKVESSLLRLCATSENEGEREFVRGFSSSRYEAEPDDFLRRWCSKESEDFLTEQGAATVLQGLPMSPIIWDVVDHAGPTCYEIFWKEAYIHMFGQPRDAEHAAKNLLSVNRALAAIDLLAANIKKDWLAGDGDVRLVVEALMKGVEEANDNPSYGQRVSYDIVRLIKALADSGRLELGELMHLEWIYFGVLEHQAEHELVIYKQLISDPELLMQLIGLIYIPEDQTQEDRPELSEGERSAARQAWRILHDWKPFEGTPSEAMPSSEEIIGIVKRVRDLAAERHHSKIVDDHIGKALASSPLGMDGVWPHESVRTVLESYNNKEITDGFVVGKESLRGTTVRSPGDGGKQELILAAQYEKWQKMLSVRSPRTSALLGRLSQAYYSEATRMDIDALIP